MAKGGRARERFREKQQYNKIVSQLNQLHAAGYTDDQIRAAGPNAWRELTQGGLPTPTTGTATTPSIDPATGLPIEPQPGPSDRGGFAPSGIPTGSQRPLWYNSTSPTGRGGREGQPSWWSSLMANRGSGNNLPAWLPPGKP